MSSNQENQASDVAVGAMAERMGITVSFATANKVVGHMPVEGNTQPMGILHGGANVVLAESLGSVGTQLNAGENRRIVGIDINATHHKATATGIVTGVATAVSIGKTLCCWDIVITNENGQRTCTARITCMILADR